MIPACTRFVSENVRLIADEFYTRFGNLRITQTEILVQFSSGTPAVAVASVDAIRHECNNVVLQRMTEVLHPTMPDEFHVGSYPRMSVIVPCQRALALGAGRRHIVKQLVELISEHTHFHLLFRYISARFENAISHAIWRRIWFRRRFSISLAIAWRRSLLFHTGRIRCCVTFLEIIALVACRPCGSDRTTEE